MEESYGEECRERGGGKVRGGEEDDIKNPDLFNLLYLLVQTSNHVIGGVRYLFHHHQTYKGIHLWVEGEEGGGGEVIVTMVTSEIYLGGEYLV